jgi:hypothetical protein
MCCSTQLPKQEANMTYSRRYQIALVALLISFVCLSTLGTVFLMATWSYVSVDIGLRRSAIFVSIMVCLHAIGAALYIAEHGGDVSLDKLLLPVPSPSLVRVIKSTIVQQLACLVFGALLLDHGHILTCCLISIVAFWTMIGSIVIRRGDAPTPWDLRLIQYGFIPLCTLVEQMSRAIGR